MKDKRCEYKVRILIFHHLPSLSVNTLFSVVKKSLYFQLRRNTDYNSSSGAGISSVHGSGLLSSPAASPNTIATNVHAMSKLRVV
jgi:hypothetical protein